MVSAKAPSPMNLPHKMDFKHSTSYKNVSSFGIDSARIPHTSFCETGFGITEDDDDESTPEPTSEPESDDSRIFAQESDEQDQSMDLDLAIASERHVDKDGAQSVNGYTSPRDEYSPNVTPIISPSKMMNEASRAKRLANFDSAVFDALIYRQSDLKPPSGVSVQVTSPKMATASSEDDRLALHVNPAIHRMHNRSEEWYKKKSKEIQSRGGRKAWFGKTIQRQRYLRSREAATEKERDMARRAGTVPPRREPQPRGHKKMLDFGVVPEKDLPDDVRKNPAWLKACAWFRETRSLPQ
ncbi:hypothetical protein QQZ08_010887 [Neonectria magnoliae]|uniref:Uncharacterized protein n=1 Tax=Neonectria magnoliae TaxID=2732573 RepID=A0ABR1HEB6_9HYPO